MLAQQHFGQPNEELLSKHPIWASCNGLEWTSLYSVTLLSQAAPGRTWPPARRHENSGKELSRRQQVLPGKKFWTAHLCIYQTNNFMVSILDSTKRTSKWFLLSLFLIVLSSGIGDIWWVNLDKQCKFRFLVNKTVLYMCPYLIFS